ncbi:xanthine dehydrogenase family protein molybdopterin-binding subunit [Solimonas sp. K1W22B-7]|uniref:xanthine dehydrogenase family protein molybdopterin-binding subunit n=1 Tax=Solimonas sp. K1W22B-7 TaxID=2303331 RepID=UPI000E335AF1|nr:xanthine dehydrogenase family protein molybdopterin-binding subunit [Solimonas sp. K1W22B-7]AXQ31526.1 xanthine dehydrogenase family protein molybdopterin-binding subunit [Solimonas sp. K1W22B-7]
MAASDGSGMTRRDFLRVSAMAGGGLLAACNFAPESEPVQAPPTPGPGPVGDAWQANAFVRIAPDNRITIIVGSAEIGQGTSTVVPMMVAEELDADWSQVSWEQSPTARDYANPRNFSQLTAGSATVRGVYLPQRRAGAAIREMLVKAAASLWGVSEDRLRTQASRVIDDAGGRSASYGELAGAAAQLRAPRNPVLKNPADFRIIGQSKRRLDGAQKSDGSTVFGSDLHIPGMLIALIARPAPSGRLGSGADTPESWNREAAMAVPGVEDVFVVDAGVVVVAQDFWAAKQGRDRLAVQWQRSSRPHVSSDEQRQRYTEKLDRLGAVLHRKGSGAQLQRRGNTVISADYHFPYLAHAPMEPLNVVIDYAPGRCEIWTGTQWPDGDRGVAARVLGMQAAQIRFNTLPSGGSFGRRACSAHDFVDEAAQVAKVLQKPVKVMWTREDDIRGGYYRPSASSRLSATLDSQGLPSSWAQRMVAQSLIGNAVIDELGSLAGTETNSAQGATDLPYAIPNQRVDVHSSYDPVTVLWMRSVSSSFNVYAREAFLDELAQAAGQDPLQYRRRLLQGTPRLLAVLDAAASAAGWGSAPAGHHQGIAVFQAYGSCIAQVVEASVGADRVLKIHRVTSAVDCGTAINPDLVAAQIESAAVFALSSVLFGEITLEDGEPQQGNFHDYPILRMHQTPRIDTVFVNSGGEPGGVGELGVPAVGPALANAIFGALGERIRELPMKKHLRID